MKSPAALGLPFETWRPGQQLAIRECLHAKTPHVVLQAPTGFGKTAVAGGLMRLDDRRQIVLTSTLGLQDQYASQLGAILADVRGLRNYECLAARYDGEHAASFRLSRRPISCEAGPCHSGAECSLKNDGCLYFDAQRAFLAAQAGVTSYSKWLYARRYGKGLGIVQRLILDEAHDLPDALMAACRIELPADICDRGLLKTPAAWAAWALRKMDDYKAKGDATDDSRVRKQKLLEALNRLTKIDDTWAWDAQDAQVVFEPTVPRLLMPYLTDTGIASQLVYLSATITPATLSLLDIPSEQITFRAMKSRFPVERRPVYLVDSVRVDYRMSPSGKEYWLSRIDRIIGKRLDRKGIIHSVSYLRAQDILKYSKYRGIMLAPRRASELAATVERFRRMKPPAILVSPSVVQGWDFPYTDCEYQIIAKTPFPDTRSSIAAARIKATPGYREHQTMQKIVQASGRGMRAADDQCETFLIDNHFRDWFLGKCRREGLVPEWFDDAIEAVAKPPDPPPPLDR